MMTREEYDRLSSQQDAFPNEEARAAWCRLIANQSINAAYSNQLGSQQSALQQPREVFIDLDKPNFLEALWRDFKKAFSL